jgi:hypothetical protein
MQPAEDLDRVPAADATFTETPQEKDLLMQFRRMSARAQFLTARAAPHFIAEKQAAVFSLTPSLTVVCLSTG